MWGNKQLYSKRQIITSIGKNGEKLDPSYILGNGVAILEKNLVVLQNVKYSVTI